MINHSQLSSIYRRYGFEERNSGCDGVYVYTLRAGHYHNADIVRDDSSSDSEKVFEQFKSSGFACKFRTYSDIRDVEKTLFKGFFNVDSTKRRLEKAYSSFTNSVVATYSDEAKYEYLDCDYQINGQEGTGTLLDEIIGRLSLDVPVLFLIEAAAGYGKTCTAYELVKALTERREDSVPLFSELSRNRQAKIFRYVFLDEIDRSFPSLSSSLVKEEVRNGRVPVLLDGFDELLHTSSDEEGYENTEPMLETIGELLQRKAKVVLTTRRTTIFDGDDFHAWMDSHGEDFQVFRIRISEPTAKQWLSGERYKSLLARGFEVDRLANPVLLSYLRCISDSEFQDALNDTSAIVDKYFNSMLERERVRQDLRMSVDEQYQILKSVARYLIDSNYTSDEREWIISVIEDKHSQELETVRRLYPSEDRPTLDELLNKLANHALLDRASDESDQIGFVNEFVFGSFCADLIIEHESGEWVADIRYIEPAVVAYTSRSKLRRYSLWLALKFCLDFTEPSQKIESMVKLTDEVGEDIVSETVDNVTLSGISMGSNHLVKETVFINSTFVNCIFDLSRFDNTTFMNCEFYGCEAVNACQNNNVYILGCDSDDEDFLSNFTQDELEQGDTDETIELQAEKFILEKYWPVGRDTFMKHRAIKALCAHTNRFSHTVIMRAINSLKKKNLLLSPDKVSFLELNIDEINSIKTILGRD